MPSTGIARNNPIERNTILSEPYGTTGELFESVLRELSTGAFKAVVNNGVRDIDGFLMLDTTALAGVSSRIAEELSAVQQRIRQNSRTHSAEHPIDHVEEFQNGSTANDIETVVAGDDHLFQLVLKCLGVRAQHALVYGHIRDLQQFMRLEKDIMANWPNTGAKTIAEILDVQRRLNDLARQCKEQGKQLDVRAVCTFLSQPVRKPRLWVEQTTSTRRSAVWTPVVRGVDEPAPWSVLKKTVPEVLSIGGHVLDALRAATENRCISDVVSLPASDWDRLAAANIYKDDPFDILLSLTLAYLMHLHISAQSLDILMNAVAHRIGVHGDALPNLVKMASNHPILADAEVGPIRNLRIDSFHVPDELLQGFSERSLWTWGDLAGLTEKGVIQASSACADALSQVRDLWRIKLVAQEATLGVSGFDAEYSAGFNSMMEAFIDLAAKSSRDKTLLQGRMGLLNNRKYTLDELGSSLGLTRERVRQLEKKMLKTLKAPDKAAKLAKFWLAVDEILRTSGGVCTLTEVAEQVAAKMEWNEKPELAPLVSLLQSTDYVVVDTHADLVYNPRHRCYTCEVVTSALEDQFAEDRSEQRLQEVADTLLSACAQTERCARYSRGLSLSEGFIRFIAHKTDDILVEDGAVYCRDTWSSKRGSRLQLVEDVVRSAGRSMHFSEVYEEIRRLWPEDQEITKRNVKSWLDRSANLVLWDRGTYIHRSHVAIPESLLAEIESWLSEKLETGVPFFSVAGAWAAFGDRLSTNGIPSETALYSCLRESSRQGLAYPRYPYVMIDSPEVERLPVSIAFEQFILESGGLASSQDIRAYAVNELGISEQLFTIHLYNVPNVIRAGKGSYVHVENLKLEYSKLGAILDHVMSLLAADGHVSIEKVFADKQISCLTMGIDSPEMLYALLQSHTDYSIELPGYPQILAVGCQDTDGGSRGIITQVADYLAVRESPCSFDELEQHFVEKLGYNAGTIYNVLTRDNVVRYSRGSVVHLDALEWTDGKQNALEAKAQDVLSQAGKAGHCHALLNHLLEYHQLPDLANAISWTQTLLGELLVRGGRFRVIGSARNAFVRIPNNEGIESFEDLAHELLRRNYDGASELDQFERDMQQSGVVRKRVTPGMLGDQRKVCISGHIIMLKELRDRA